MNLWYNIFMNLDVQDIDFLLGGKFGLRYINGRPDLLAAHQRPEGVDGDCYCLSGLAPLLPADELKKFPVHLGAVLANKAALPALLEKALGKIVDRALNESPNEGASITFLLLKDMAGANAPYDVHPEYAPTGKAGRKTILPQQIVATIRLTDLELLDGQINRELGQGPTPKDMLIDKIIGGIAKMRIEAPTLQKTPAARSQPLPRNA